MQRFINHSQSNQDLGGSNALKLHQDKIILAEKPTPAPPRKYRVGDVSEIGNFKCYKLRLYL
jgi:hypothetical protein